MVNSLSIRNTDIRVDVPEDFEVRYNSINSLELNNEHLYGMGLESLETDILFYTDEGETNDKKRLAILKLIKSRNDNHLFAEEFVNLVLGVDVYEDTNNTVRYPDGRETLVYKPYFPRLNHADFLFILNNVLGYGYKFEEYNYREEFITLIKLLSSEDIYKIIQKIFYKRLFMKYFNTKDPTNDIYIAQKRLQEFINSSCGIDHFTNADAVFDLNINTDLLLNNEIKTDDEEFNELIDSAKSFFIQNDKQTAIEKLWDAFERIKTYKNTNKTDSFVIKMALSSFKEELLQKEFRELTSIGNDYRIRHHESGKVKLDNSSREYLFFRLLSLLHYLSIKIEESKTS